MEDIHEKIKQLHSEGKDDPTISKILNVSTSHIGRIRKYILDLPSQRAIRLGGYYEKIAELHHQGFTDAAISRELGIPSSSVQYCRKKLMGLATHHEEKTYDTEEDRIRGYMIRNIKGSAKRRGIEFNMNFTDIELPTHCPLLGIPLRYRDVKGFNDNDRATVDRIDNTKGYIKGNTWVISRLANSMKNEATLEQLETFVENVKVMLENQRARGGITVS